jgi:hypothetical protein
VALAYTGCKNACKDTLCLNSGTCNDGKCECVGRYGGVNCDTFCPVGYEGDNCEIQNRAKFIKNWSSHTRTSAGADFKHALVVSAGSSISTVVISNIAGQAFSVVGTVGGRTNMDIYQQNALGNYTGKASGSGVYSDRKLTINLTLENGTTYFMECTP